MGTIVGGRNPQVFAKVVERNPQSQTTAQQPHHLTRFTTEIVLNRTKTVLSPTFLVFASGSTASLHTTLQTDFAGAPPGRRYEGGVQSTIT